ncbi:general substrate transporter [Leucosporidium creatinivorum]|uniref:General substrate transporter n=1 Tax=Leucosporidium creatinivorum TaxID=106004 RepID=A0A1Y2FQ29_9BASI|nr:general substrate transporter [Leucosporidium creatinivorum]
MSGLISAPQFLDTFPDCDPELQGAEHAATMQAFYVAIYEVGCLAGAIFALGYGDRLGRLRMMKIASYVMMVGVLIQVTAFAGHKAAAQFIIGRVITGLGNGANTATIPTWHAETAKSHNRGLLVCIEAAMISSGTAIAYWVDYGFSFIPTSTSWRVPIALQCIFAIGLLIMIEFLPESPRWLVSHGDFAEAQRVVAALEPAPFHSDIVLDQTRVILDSLEGAKARRKKDVLTGGPTQHLRRMLIGASSQIMQQIGGCNAVIYFAPVIFQEQLMLDRNLSLILGGVNVTVYALAAFISFITIERLGRRKLFLIGSLGQALSMFLIMACTRVGSQNALKGAVVGLFLYLIFFGFTWLQLPWLYPAEINPLATRTNANAISTINNWLFNFAIVMATPPLLTSIGYGTFALFGALNVCFIPIIWVFYPETAGRTLEEIDVIFAIGYIEKKHYVTVANEMPSLGPQEIEAEWTRLGLGQMPHNTEA